MKPQRKYDPAKVKDPQTQGHAVRLQARQPFLVILSGLDKGWDLKLNSDFLFIEEVVFDYERDQIHFKVAQKYDLQEWSYISHVFLGNAYVEREGGEKVTLCVYLDCRNKKKYSVLTVINPKDHLVKMEPHQLLQVALWTEPYVNWSATHNFHMFDEIKYETVINDMRHVYDKSDVFCCEPRAVDHKVNPEVKSQVEEPKAHAKKVIEHHYWYRIKKDQLEKAGEYENGCYRVGKLTFRHFNNPACGTTSFDIMVSLRNSTREKIDMVLYDAITHRMNQWNMRQYDPHNQIVMYPNVSENIDLKPNQDFFYVELPQPSVYFPVFHDNVFWRAESGDLTYFQITELEARLVNGKYVQRFFIQNIMDPKNFATTELAKSMPFIGHVKFVCRKLVELGGKVERTITLNFWKKKEGASYTTGSKPTTVFSPSKSSSSLPLVKKETGGFCSGYAAGYAGYAGSSCTGSSSKSSNSIYDDEPLVAEVELEQTKNCDLGKGAITIRLCAIRDTIISKMSYGGETQSYYWEKRKKKLKDKGGREEMDNYDLDPSLWFAGM